MIGFLEKTKSAAVSQRGLLETLVFMFEAALANYFAFVLRFESLLPERYRAVFFVYLPLLLAIRMVFYAQSGLHRGIWRYSSIGDLVKIVMSATLGTAVFLVIVRYLIGDIAYPRSVYILDWLLLIMITGGSRLFIRVYRDFFQIEHPGKRVLIVGAGDAGEMLVRDMRQNPAAGYEPIGFIAEDAGKKGHTIHGVPIFGTRAAIKEVIEKHGPEEVVIAMPGAGLRDIKAVFELLRDTRLPIKTLPVLGDVLKGGVSISEIRPLSLEDLLQREPVKAEIASVSDYIRGKAVMVTGAGGSIGSELSRQILLYGPSELIVLDRYENGLFEIDLELRRTAKDTVLSTVVCDILDEKGLEGVFSAHRPRIVFHAAAHKHVPLMEHNRIEAVKNNVFGTRNLLRIAALGDVESFVMISTDKAVNPTSFMGATKRTAEFLTISMNRRSPARFTVVRFGNVLGSNASIVQIFKEQLKRGGPLTVTHPDMKRFFMLVSEAVELVLTASAGGKGGEVFVLDMGEPIRIVELAENLVRLSGLAPHEDIKIEFTGPRPGEKLFEELFDDYEEMMPAFHEKLRIAMPRRIPSDEEIERHVSALKEIVDRGDTDALVSEFRKVMPGFKKNGEPAA